MICDTCASPFAKLSGIPFRDAEWTGGLYRERFDTVAQTTVPHLRQMFEDRETSHVVENFRIAAGEAEGDFGGTVFGDGDFYKWFEAAACTAVGGGNENLLARLEEYIALFARAQQPDGYLSTKQIIGEKQGKGSLRQGDINDFEVYNMGHLFTAACLYTRLTGKRSFLNVAEKAAGYLKSMYEEAARTGEVKTAVCPSHYMGVIELYRTTGKKEYLELARLSVRLRDSVRNGQDDNQDRIPLRQHRKIVGHAVRANYLYAGLTDLYMEEGNPEDRQVLDSVWEHLTTRKLYITGGCGALYNGASPYGNFFRHQLVHQAYGYEYQLPNVTAYNETCASLGGVFWAWRMFLAEPREAYIGALERMLLNVNMAGISLDGKKFFYANMLRRTKKLDFELVWGRERTEYISSYCCPPNLARTLAQTSEYAYGTDRDGVWTGLYGANTARFSLRNGAAFTLIQETDYPFDGKIAFRVSESNGIPFQLHFRIPAWAEGAEWTEGGRTEKKPAGTYVSAEAGRDFSGVLNLPMRPRLTVGNDMIEEDRNQAAVEAGPLVYCIESADIPEDTELSDLLLPVNASFRPAHCVISGREIHALETTMLRREKQPESLYHTLGNEPLTPVRVRMIPYYAWDNRGAGEMAVWLPLAWREV